MRRGNSAFYGDSGTVFSGPARDDLKTGNNVDFSQRHAGSDMAGQDDAEQVVKGARRSSPRSVQDDPVKSKRLDDEIRARDGRVRHDPARRCADLSKRHPEDDVRGASGEYD